MRFFFGKRVLVVGGSRGIGRALALHLASRGATVCIAARKPADLAAARAIARCIERGVVDGSIGFDSWLLRAGRRFLPALIRRLTDGEVRKALAATEQKEATCPT